MNTTLKRETEIIVPVGIGNYGQTKESIVENILYQHRTYGVYRFALACPGKGWRMAGYPPKEEFERLARLFLEIKNELSPYGIECGWWFIITMKSGTSDKFTTVVRRDGTKHPFANCPLCPDFRKAFAQNVALFAKIAKPAFIITEDDLSIESANGCFCEHHLDEFEKMMGRRYSREELVTILFEKYDENLDIVRKWRELMKESHVGLARVTRAELDKESPEIPMGCCQTGGSDFDGNVTEDICRAFAGDKHVPFSRLFGTFYSNHYNVKQLPELLSHAIQSKQHIKGNFKYLHETDCYPHSKFYTPARYNKAAMSAVYSYGFDGSLYQTGSEETCYGMLVNKEWNRFDEVRRIAKMCEISGVEVNYDPFYNSVDMAYDTIAPLWIRCISAFGIPYTTVDSDVTFWDVRQAKYADDETVMKKLSKGLFLDGDAAKALYERGYGKYIGVNVGDDPVKGTMTEFDLGARETITEAFAKEGESREMTCAHMYSPSGKGRWLALEPNDEKCEVITEAYTFKKEFICNTMTRFENSLGGKVVVMAITLDRNRSHALLNYRRQRLLGELVAWCSDSYVFAKGTADVFVTVNKAKNTDCGFMGMVTLINLCEDELEGIELHFPKDWQNVKELCILDKNGEWQELSFEKTQDGVRIDKEIRFCEPAFVLVK